MIKIISTTHNAIILEWIHIVEREEVSEIVKIVRYSCTNLMEIDIMTRFEHPNLMSCKYVTSNPNFDENDRKIVESYLDYKILDKKYVFIIMDKMYCDLSRVLQNVRKLTNEMKKFFVFQLVNAVYALKSVDVEHLDIKPSNILISAQGVPLLGDFGNCQILGVKNLNHKYTCTYRPPELFYTNSNTNSKCDIWALGLLLLEIFTEFTLFDRELYNKLKNDTEIVVLENIKILSGTYGLRIYDKGNTNECWYEICSFITLQNTLLNEEKRKEIIGKVEDENLRTLIDSMLQQDYEKRFSIEQVIESPYFAGFAFIKANIQKYTKTNITEEMEEKIRKILQRNITGNALKFGMKILNKLFLIKGEITDNDIICCENILLNYCFRPTGVNYKSLSYEDMTFLERINFCFY